MQTESDGLCDRLAHALRQFKAQDLTAAAALCQQILEETADHAAALYLLGVVRLQQGAHREAVSALEKSLAVNEAQPACHANLGEAYRGLGDAAKARFHYERAVQLKPDYSEIHNNFGLLLQSLGDNDAAAASFEKALQYNPRMVQPYTNLGSVHRSQGRIAEAEACYRRALQLNPDSAEANFNLGNLLSDLGRRQEAEASYRQALQVRPNHAKSLRGLGRVLAQQGRRSDAVLCCQQAVRLSPNYAQAWDTMGSALREQGRLDEAAEAFRRALALDPASPAIHSNVLQCEQYCPGVTPAKLARLHADWDARHAEPLRSGWSAHPNDRDPDRPLRIGIVSPDLGNNPVGILTIRGLESLDPQSMRLYFYSGRRGDDDRTRRFRRLGEWREVRLQSDDGLARQIRDDKIDVLFDLSGHVGGNRLPVFARKPAPVQITWAGYVGTTGLKAMDYLVADPHQVPDGDDAHYRERILRLTDCYASYDPPGEAPDVGPSPAARAGTVTFGGAHNPSKINPDVVGAWAEILRRVPDSRMQLRYRGLDDPPVQRRYRELFTTHGIDPARVELSGWCPPPELLAWYGSVDIALDPFPYSGGVTTCDALWMGVPVVTLVGSTFAGRHAYTYLCNVGLTELACKDVADYVKAAVTLAKDTERLTELRSQLRGRMLTEVCDGTRFAQGLQAAIRGAWRDWCASHS